MALLCGQYPASLPSITLTATALCLEGQHFTRRLNTTMKWLARILLKKKPRNGNVMPDCILVAMWDGIPVASAPTHELLVKLLNEYNGSVFTRYVAHDSKYPSINELEGVYYYTDSDGSEDAFKIRSVEFKGE